MENLLTVGQNVSKGESKLTNLTDISVNDFLKDKTTEPDFQLPSNFAQQSSNIQTSEFNTMQMLFQTNNLGQTNLSAFNQMGTNNPNAFNQMGVTATQPQGNLSSMNFGFNATQVEPNDKEFNTLRNMFQTSNYENLTINRPSQVNEQKPQIQDFFKNTKPEAFATMGGGGSGNVGFNMANFGTMQVNTAQNPQGDLNFFSKKPNTPSTTGGVNLI